MADARLMLAWMILAALVASPSLFAQTHAAGVSATIVKPAAKARTVTTGVCRILHDGTFIAHWGPEKLPTLSFTIGPHSAMSDECTPARSRLRDPDITRR